MSDKESSVSRPSMSAAFSMSSSGSIGSVVSSNGGGTTSSVETTSGSAVMVWMMELRFSTEMECMTVLQSKSIRRGNDLSGRAVKNAIDFVRTEADAIGCEFKDLFACVDTENWPFLSDLTVDVTCHIRFLIQECNKHICEPPAHFVQQQEVVMGECAKLAQRVESVYMSTRGKTARVPLINQLVYLGESFSRFVDLALGLLVQTIVFGLELTADVRNLLLAISDVISLGMEGDHMCYILVREGVMQSLFNICNMETLLKVRAQALRAISTICCIPESIQELEKVGGLECLTDILSDKAQGEEVRGEAAGVVAQATSPAHEHHLPMVGLIDNMNDLLKTLIDLCHTAISNEVFLLASAAIANITFMDSNASDILLYLKAPSVLLQCCLLNKATTIFAKDQVASILANMAVMESCQAEISRQNGIDILLNYLHEEPSSFRSAVEIAACERVLQKAAIALTRLSRDECRAQLIAKSQGIPRLVKLCRNANSRNNSDAVLVACLAALRKICSVCGNHGVDPKDFKQLIEPRLMDSFLICTHTEENFV
ncbi:Protein inscuteable homolog [Octopus vulgaris]|uniref:Protein inscuteable homolog n=1 Tax=Octopus vulgaris TaxID=6645 RepID=A0AA36FKF2_OCTVU|nr:Protein inscuteable homolog [Octopus vulgaris]